MDFVFLNFLVIFSVSSAAEVVPLRGSFCLGEPAEWTCTAHNSLQWRNQPIGAAGPLITVFTASDSYTQPEQDLASVGPIRVLVTCLRGTEFLSRARVNMDSSLNGTRLECAGSGESFGLINATVDLSVTEPSDISYLIAQLIPGNIIIFDWGGAQCVNYYRIEVNGVPVTTTTDTSYSYLIPPNNSHGITITVYGINFAGNNFTNISKTLTGPICNASQIQPDINGVLRIMVEKDNADQLPVRHCNLIFNSATYDCSENRVIGFYVIPGEYNYSVVMSNAVGSTVCANGTETAWRCSECVSCVMSHCLPATPLQNPDEIRTCATVLSSSTVSSIYAITVTRLTPTITTTLIVPTPTTLTSPQECELPLWALIVMIALGILLVLAAAFYSCNLWWRHRCCCRKCFCEDEDCCCQGCWDSPFSTYFFCECFKKAKRVATTNLRTKSPDQEEMVPYVERTQ